MAPGSGAVRTLCLAAVGVLLCVGNAAATSCAVTCTAERPALHVSVWKADLIPYEPILIRVSLKNTSGAALAVAPPYVDLADEAVWPLRFEVRDRQGGRVPSGVDGGRRPYAAALYGSTWWCPCLGPGQEAPPVPPWRLVAGKEAYWWMDLTQFYPLTSPGTHAVTFTYRSTDQMLAGKTSYTEQTWVGELSADPVTITIHEPGAGDAEAAAAIRTYRTQRDVSLMDGDGLHTGFPANDLKDALTGTTYEPYADFARVWHSGQGAQHFAERHPGFPLSPQLAVLAERKNCEWKLLYSDVGDAMSRVQRARQAGTDDSAVRADLARAVDAFRAALAAYRKKVDELGDYELLGESSVWEWRCEQMLKGVEAN